MKQLVLFLTVLFFMQMSFAINIDDYTFSSTTATYNSIFDPWGTTPSVNWGSNGDDALSSSIPIGFSFPFCGSNYSQIKISTNGWISLGTSITNSYYNNSLDNTYLDPIIAPLWDDLKCIGSLISQTYVMYQTDTSTNPDVFTVEYKNVKWNYDGNPVQNFQIKLWSDGKIDFIYGSGGTPNDPSASIGVCETGHFISVTPNTYYSTTIENQNIANLPPSGRRFRFTPPDPLPDLVIQNVSVPDNVSQNQNIYISYRIKNIGSGTVNQASITKIFYDPDSVYGNGNAIEIYSQTEGPLSPNAYFDRTVSVTIPQNAVPAYGYICISADDVNDIQETDDINNRVLSPKCWCKFQLVVSLVI